MSNDGWEDIAYGPPIATTPILTATPHFVDATGQAWDKKYNPMGSGTAPVPLSQQPIAAAPADVWEDIAYGPTAPRTWSETASDLGKSVVKGVSVIPSLGETVLNYNPVETLAQTLGINIDAKPKSIEALRSEYVGDPQYRNAGLGERTISQGIGSIPLAAMGGGVPAAFSSGAVGELGKAVGLPEWVGQMVGGVGSGLVQDGARAVASRAPNWSDGLVNRALGFTKADLKTSARRSGVDVFDYVIDDAGKTTKVLKNELETKLSKSLKTVKEDGLLDQGFDPETVYKTAESKIDELATKVNEVIRQADTALGAQKVYPSFKNAETYINKVAPVTERAKLRKELQAWKEAIRTEGDGTVSFLQNQKVEIGARTYGGGQEAAEGFDKALTSDFQQTIERVTDGVLGTKGKVSSLNRKLGAYLDTLPTLKNNFSASTLDTPEQVMMNLAKTTGGIMAPVIAGQLSYGTTGAILGALLGTGVKAINTPTGRKVAAQGLNGFSSISEAMPNVLRASTIVGSPAASAGNVLQEISKQNDPLSSKAELAEERAEATRKKSEQKMPSSNNADLPPIPSQLKKKVSTLIFKQPPIVQAVIQVESGGNPRAVSPTGPKGLMQLTAANRRKLGVTDAFDPEQSIKAGTELLQEEMKRFKDPMIALAAYNQGAPVVQKAVQRARLAGKEASWENVAPYLPEEGQEYPLKIAAALEKMGLA